MNTLPVDESASASNGWNKISPTADEVESPSTTPEPNHNIANVPIVRVPCGLAKNDRAATIWGPPPAASCQPQATPFFEMVSARKPSSNPLVFNRQRDHPTAMVGGKIEPSAQTRDNRRILRPA